MDAENTAVKQPEQTDAQPEIGEKQVDTQVSEKQDNTHSQEDVNRIVADRVAREKLKFEKKYSGVDLDLYKELVEEKETQRQTDLKKRGQFEEMLKEQAEKSYRIVVHVLHH